MYVAIIHMGDNHGRREAGGPGLVLPGNSQVLGVPALNALCWIRSRTPVLRGLHQVRDIEHPSPQHVALIVS